MIIKFSIIVVSLNTKLDLIKTLNSIFKQKYKKYEIIVIDGLSSDGSIEYIRKLKNKNICKIIERDKGIYDAMNKGIKKAKNKWTIFLNSGDTFYNSFTLLNVLMSKILLLSSMLIEEKEYWSPSSIYK